MAPAAGREERVPEWVEMPVAAAVQQVSDICC